MAEELPPGVIDNDGHYEVDPALMSVYPQFATDFEVQRIVTDRLEYLYWVQRHFTDQVLPPHPEGDPARSARPGEGDEQGRPRPGEPVA